MSISAAGFSGFLANTVPSATELIENFDAAFNGADAVLEVEIVVGLDGAGWRVLQSFKGPHEIGAIVEHHAPTSCDMEFGSKVGERFVVFATFWEDRLRTAVGSSMWSEDPHIDALMEKLSR